MIEKTTVNVDLRDVQEKVEDSMKSAQDMSRKLTLAYVGMWGLAYDKAQELWNTGMEFVDKAEKRGEEFELEWNKQFGKLQEKPELKKVVDYVEDGVDVVSKNAKTVVNEVEKFLTYFQPKAEEVIKTVTIEVENPINLIIAGYDEMAAKDIVSKLAGMPKENLLVVREYEVKGKNRVTVLREVDVLLETPDVVAA